jgi:hypothetical protein
MKKIFVAEVPEGYYIGTVNLIPNDKNSSKWAINGECKELILPSDEEIEQQAEGQLHPNDAGFGAGANWLKSLIE